MGNSSYSAVGADVGLGPGGCDFLASMQALHSLSLARTRLEHAALGAALGGLSTLTVLSLAWCAHLPARAQQFEELWLPSKPALACCNVCICCWILLRRHVGALVCGVL